MATVVIVFAILLAFFGLLYYLTRSKFSHLPGPGWRDYLPGGQVFAMLADSRKIGTSLMAMRAQYGSVFQLWLGPEDCIVTSVPADLAQALGAADMFDRPVPMVAMLEVVVPGSLFTMPKEAHIAARKHLRDSFNFSFLHEFHPHMVEATEELCDALSEAANRPSDEYVNITSLVSITTFRVITNAAFGCNLSRDERLEFSKATIDVIEEMLADYVGYPIRQALTIFGVRNRLFESKKKVHHFSRKFIQQRLDEAKQQKEARPADLLDAILTLKDHDLTSLTSQTVLYAIAGSHTTNELLAWAIFEIACNPDIAAEIQRELSEIVGSKPLEHEDVEKLPYLKCVWQEALRMHPPGVFFSRTASHDLTLNGSRMKVKKGGHVLSLTHGGHKSADVWSEPEKFIPERWGPEMQEGKKAPPGAYMPFSIGRRNCAGRFLADYEAILILAELYRKFEFKLACKQEEVVSCSGWIQSARTSIDGSDLGFGVPVHVSTRS